jgi:hypothetical protein
MFATFLTIALFAASAINGVAADDSDDQFSVNTPSITQVDLVVVCIYAFV